MKSFVCEQDRCVWTPPQGAVNFYIEAVGAGGGGSSSFCGTKEGTYIGEGGKAGEVQTIFYKHLTEMLLIENGIGGSGGIPQKRKEGSDGTSTIISSPKGILLEAKGGKGGITRILDKKTDMSPDCYSLIDGKKPTMNLTNKKAGRGGDGAKGGDLYSCQNFPGKHGENGFVSIYYQIEL